jgi:uncharacterized SAM-binding protein YcdF (DUF218 family)
LPAVVWMSTSCSADGSVTLVMVHDAIGTPVLMPRAAAQMSPYDRTVFRRVLAIGAAVAVVVVVAVGVSGQWLFADAPDDALHPVDAVVVLGGEHDGREEYGIQLAQEIGASAVLLSNPYPSTDAIMSNLCNIRRDRIEVICRAPVPATTRGEALMAQQIAKDRGWGRIAVVTWRFHLLRARLIFDQCYSAEPDRTIMRAVPKVYDLPFAIWQYIYFYQTAAIAKSLIQGRCTSTI